MSLIDPVALSQSLGQQLVCWAIDCAADVLADETALSNVLTDLCTHRGLTILGQIAHRYEPQGLTVGLILAESHIIAHTWPEHKIAHIDFFSCIPFDTTAFTDDICRLFGARHAQPLFKLGSG